ncbi:hypothetical protein V8G54_023731 [Vigna mungo]|uniref:Uncharacterized protein n=1 Tax=Vigna mungo TaxID=3915 RepID=A0AAQ3N3P4_VIGMU
MTLLRSTNKSEELGLSHFLNESAGFACARQHYDGTPTAMGGWVEGRRDRLGFVYGQRHCEDIPAALGRHSGDTGWLGGGKTTPSRFCLGKPVVRRHSNSSGG